MKEIKREDNILENLDAFAEKVTILVSKHKDEILDVLNYKYKEALVADKQWLRMSEIRNVSINDDVILEFSESISEEAKKILLMLNYGKEYITNAIPPNKLSERKQEIFKHLKESDIPSKSSDISRNFRSIFYRILSEKDWYREVVHIITSPSPDD